ncbi:MAG: DnaJ domain-containing protein [Bauldia sp.]
MSYLIAGGVTFGILWVLAQAYANADARALVRSIRYGIGGAVALVGLLLLLTGRWGVGGILIAAGFSAIATGRLGPFDLGGGVRHAGTDSSVKTDWFDMRLDHDTGAMSGVVRRGEFAGRGLDDLNEIQLMKLAAAVAGIADSAALLEAYLDRRIPGWREDVEGDRNAGAGGAANAGAMTDKEAYEVLGLLPGATEAEIRAAHRRLMKAVHPDQGGSTFLAAKINQAKDRLLDNHH